MEIRLTFQERLKDLRTERGMTLSDLEKATGISRSSLGKYESDECKEVSHASIVTLAKYYGVTSDYLLGLSENKNPANADLSDLHLQDDVIEILRISEDVLIGQAPEITRHMVELRGIGVVDIKSLYGVESVMEFSGISMIINLEEWNGQLSYDRLGLNEEYQEILGVKVVKHTIPIRPGRNLAIIIETAAVNHRQKQMGYNAAQALCDRVTEEIIAHREENEQEG